MQKNIGEYMLCRYTARQEQIYDKQATRQHNNNINKIGQTKEISYLQDEINNTGFREIHK